MLDVSHPARPIAVGESAILPDVVRRIAITGHYAVIAAGRAGLRVFDLADAQEPREVGALPTPNAAGQLVLVQRYAYVPDRTGIRIVDLADPSHPTEAAFYETAERPLGLQVVGSRAYVGIGQALHILDVSNPVSPLELGSCQTPDAEVQSLLLAGTRAYVLAEWNGEPMYYLADVADPSAPRCELVAEYFAPNIPQQPAAVIGNGPYVLNGDLSVTSMENPGHPRRIPEWDRAHTGREAVGLTIQGSYGYAVYGSGGLRILDLRDPARPIELARYETPDVPAFVAIAGDRAYVTDMEPRDGRLQILDLGDPARPRELGQYPVAAFMVAVADDHAYIAATNGLRILDVSDPSNPTEVGSYQSAFPELITRVTLSAGHAYLDGGLSTIGRIRILDVTNPANPQAVGYYDLPHEGQRGAILSRADIGTWPTDEFTSAIAATHDRLYIAATRFLYQTYPLGPDQTLPHSLHIVDVGEPAAPVQIGFLRLPATFAYDMALVGRYAVVLTWEGGWRDPNRVASLHLVDVSDPMKPTEVAQHVLPEAPVRLLADGTRLYLIGGSTIRVLDVADPLRPIEVGWYRLPGQVASLAARGDYLYVAVGEAGLAVLRLDEGSRQ